MLKLKIPPVVVVLIFGMLMWGIDYYIRSVILSFGFAQWIAALFFILGGLLGVIGLIQFYWNATTINPHRPDNTSELVTNGIYSISRNPMYLALLFILIGYGCYLGNLSTLLLIPFFIAYMNRYQIIPEEEIMAEKFQDVYLSYKSEVRRWL